MASFLFQPYDQNNVLWLNSQVSSNNVGTLTFVNPTPAANLAFALSGAGVDGLAELTIHFFDDTSDVHTTRGIPDWTNGGEDPSARRQTVNLPAARLSRDDRARRCW